MQSFQPLRSRVVKPIAFADVREHYIDMLIKKYQDQVKAVNALIEHAVMNDKGSCLITLESKDDAETPKAVFQAVLHSRSSLADDMAVSKLLADPAVDAIYSIYRSQGYTVSRHDIDPHTHIQISWK